VARIFISHSSANNAAALAVAKWLADNGWDDYFLDVVPQRGLAPGERWQEALKAAADRCEAVLFLVSPAWRDSRWCLAEFLLAKQLGKTIFGVAVETTPIDTLPGEMTAEWQLCDLATGAERVTFQVSHDPLVPEGEVSFARGGLERLRVGLQKAGLNASTFPWPPSSDPGRNPYRGLKALEAVDAAVFFGRDAVIVRGLDALRGMRERGVERMLVILGASGAGKSSFLRAGLLPRLARDDRRFLPLPVIRPERAAISGAAGLAASLEAAFREHKSPRTRAAIRKQLEEPGALNELLAELQALERPGVTGDGPAPTVVLAIDQGEELFVTEARSEAELLLARLAETLAPPEGEDAEAIAARGRAIGIVAIRSDSYEGLQTEQRLAQTKALLFSLPPIERAQFKTIVEGPAERATAAGHRLQVDPNLTERLLDDAQGADALPLLAFTLERLFLEYGGDGSLRLSGYEELGGVQGSIAAAIAAAFAEPGRAPAIPADPSERERCLRLGFIPWLARVDPDTEERKRRVARWEEVPVEARPLLERLIEVRLLERDRRRVAGMEEETVVVEIAHEALLRQWQTLTSWLDADADRLKALGAVQRAAGEWQKNRQAVSWLVHTGERLEAAEALRRRADFERLLGTEGQAYLSACRAREDDARKRAETGRQQELERARQEAKKARRTGLVLGALGLLALVAAGIAGWMTRSANRARLQAEEALAAADVTMAHLLAKEGREAEGLRHLVRAARLTPASSARRSELFSWLLRPANSLVVVTHGKLVFSAKFSPDGQRIVTASADETGQVWDARSGQPIGSPLKHGNWVTSAKFSPDGQRIVTASADKTARVWDARSGQPMGSPFKHGQPVNSAEFSPDGARIVTASSDETARVWDAGSGRPIGSPLKHDKAVLSARFSRDGERIVTVANDYTARIWDARSGQPIGSPLKHEKPVLSAEFSPEGARIVTASRDKTAQVWDAHSGRPVGSPLRHESAVRSAEFSPDGQLIVTVSDDHATRVWDARAGQLIGTPLRHEGGISSAAFSPSGERIVTASLDKTARVWDTRSGKPIGAPLKHADNVLSAEFSPDGERVVTASSDGTGRVWDALPGHPVGLPLKHEGNVLSAQFSPGGERVVTASEDETAQVWDARSGHPIGPPLKHASRVTSAEFSPDGVLIVTASWDKTARVWDARSGRAIGSPLQHESSVFSAHFCPNGERIVTVSDDNAARVWDARSGRAIGSPLQHESSVLSAQFSRDGEHIVTASTDHTARVWDARSGQAVGSPLKHEDVVFSAQFSSDGRRIVTACGAAARVWDARSGRTIGSPLKHESSVLSVQFSPDGERIVTASSTIARLWDANSGQPIGSPLTHEQWIRSAQFSPDGERVVTGSDDETARVWDARSGQPIGSPLKHEGNVLSAQFSPDGERIVTVSDDKTARVWDSLAGDASDTAALSELAEAVSGYSFNKLGALVPLPDRNRALARLRNASAAAPAGQANVRSFMRWLFDNPGERTVWPLSTIPVPEYICSCLADGRQGEAERAFSGHPLLVSDPPGKACPLATPADPAATRPGHE
jgi:WD40 repeat protein